MAILDEIRIPKSPDVESEAVALLVAQLGAAKTAVFLRDHFSRDTDYLDFKSANFNTDTVDNLARKIKARRKR